MRNVQLDKIYATISIYISFLNKKNLMDFIFEQIVSFCTFQRIWLGIYIVTFITLLCCPFKRFNHQNHKNV